MADTFELDIDRERVHVDGEWLTVEDLTTRIKSKIAAGDYRVARLSSALERLEETLSRVSTMEIKLTPEVLETFKTIATFEEQPLSLVIRRALVYYIASEDATIRLFKARRAKAAAGEAAD